MTAERKWERDTELTNSWGPPHPGTNMGLRTRTLTPGVEGKTIGGKKHTFYVL